MSNGEIVEEEIPEEEDSYGTKDFPGAEEFSDNEEKIAIKIEVAGTEAGISPLDPDFLLFALPFAFINDLILAVLEILMLFTKGATKIIAIVVNIIVLIILGSWMHWRLKRIEKNKKDYADSLKKAALFGIKKLSKLQKIGDVSPKVFERYIRLYGKQMGKIGRATAKAATKPLTKALIRGGLSALGGFIVILGLIPFWTIMVILSLREK